MPTHKPVETTPANVRAIADELARNVTELRALADAVADAGFPQLAVTNFDQLSRSVVYVNNYTKAAKNALWKAREERGDYGTKPKNKKK